MSGNHAAAGRIGGLKNAENWERKFPGRRAAVLEDVRSGLSHSQTGLKHGMQRYAVTAMVDRARKKGEVV